MKHPRLEAQRENSDPKCATCRNWAGRDSGVTSAECDLQQVRTLDLAVCSAWELHEILIGQPMEPDDVR